MKAFITSLFAIIVILLCNPVMGAFIIQGTDAGTFINPSGSSGMIVSGVGTNTFYYGDPSNFGTGANRLSFAGQNFTTEPESVFTLGTLTYFNGTTLIGTTPTSVELNINLSITDPVTLNNDFKFHLDLVSTPNTNDPRESADYVYLPSMYSGTTFSINGTDYTLKLFFKQSESDEGFTEIDKFYVLENCEASAEILGVITTDIHPAPIPGAIWLLGSALLGLVFKKIQAVS